MKTITAELDGRKYKIMQSSIKNNTYDSKFAEVLEEKENDRFKTEIFMKKRDFLRWLTEGKFNFMRPCDLATQRYYGKIKFNKLCELFSLKELMTLDNAFAMTEGEFSYENIPESWLEDK